MNIEIRTTPQERIRADQAGDWYYTDDARFRIYVSDEIDTRESQLAVAIHELVEAFLCRKHGIRDSEVCAFDEVFEEERKMGMHTWEKEAGDDPRAPYRDEHSAATLIEFYVCGVLGLSWKSHERSVLGKEADHLKTPSPDPSPPESSEPPPQHALD